MVSSKYLIAGASIVLAVSAGPVPQDFSGAMPPYDPEEDQAATPVEDAQTLDRDPDVDTSNPNISWPTDSPSPPDDSEAGQVVPLEKRCFLGLCKLFGGGSSGGSTGGSSSTSSNTSSNTCTTSSCSTACTQGTMTCAMVKIKRTILG